jgi:hypothetical protein
MKKIFSNNRLIAIAFFTVFSVASAPVVLANHSNNAIPVELKFIKYIKDQPLFQLSFSGDAENDEFTIIIRDEYSNTLYRENIKGENFTKSFLLNTDEIGDDSLQFEIISKKSKKSVVYEINCNTRFAEEVAVNELK